MAKTTPKAEPPNPASPSPETLEEWIHRLGKIVSSLKVLGIAAASVVVMTFVAGAIYNSATQDMKLALRRVTDLETMNKELEKRMASAEADLKLLKASKISGIKVVEYGGSATWTKGNTWADCPRPVDQSGAVVRSGSAISDGAIGGISA